MLERDLRLVGADRRPLPRRPDHLRANRSTSSAAPRTPGLPSPAGVSINHLTLNENDIGAYRTFFKLSPPLRAEDDRAGAWSRRSRDGTDRRHRLRPRSAGRRDQAPALRRSRRRRHRARNHAAGRRLRLVHNGDVDAAARCSRRCRRGRRNCSACPAARCAPARPPTSSWSIPTRPGCSIRPSSSRNPRTRRSTKPRLQGRVAAHHRCRAHRLRIRLIRFRLRATRDADVMLDPISWQLDCPVRCGARLRLSARLDPVRPAADTGSPASATSAIIGSGNIGATNVLRTGNKGLAAATLLLRHR